RAALDQTAISGLIGGSLNGLCLCRSDGFCSRGYGVDIVRSINRHERLSSADKLPRIYQAARDLSGNSETKIALDTRRDNARECGIHSGRRTYYYCPNQLRLCSWV